MSVPFLRYSKTFSVFPPRAARRKEAESSDWKKKNQHDTVGLPGIMDCWGWFVSLYVWVGHSPNHLVKCIINKSNILPVRPVEKETALQLKINSPVSCWWLLFATSHIDSLIDWMNFIYHKCSRGSVLLPQKTQSLRQSFTTIYTLLDTTDRQ